MTFNEDSRVKIPAILHWMRLGYHYIAFKEKLKIEENNIFSFFFVTIICSSDHNNKENF